MSYGGVELEVEKVGHVDGVVVMNGVFKDKAKREKIQKEFGLPDEEERDAAGRERTAKRAAAIRKRTNRRGARPGGKR